MTDKHSDRDKDRAGGDGGVDGNVDRSVDRGDEAAPRTADEQDSPEPVRPPTIQEKKGQAARSQDDPPKAEGNRDEADPSHRKD